MAKTRFERTLNRISKSQSSVKNAGLGPRLGTGVGFKIVQTVYFKSLRAGFRRGKR